MATRWTNEDLANLALKLRANSVDLTTQRPISTIRGTGTCKTPKRVSPSPTTWVPPPLNCLQGKA